MEDPAQDVRNLVLGIQPGGRNADEDDAAVLRASSSTGGELEVTAAPLDKQTGEGAEPTAFQAFDTKVL